MERKLLPLILISFFQLLAQAQNDWIHFSGPDNIGDFEIHDNQLWVISANGLTQIDLANEETNHWNKINSDLPHFGFDEMAVDTSGAVWLGGFSQDMITKFDGNQWETFTEVNGNAINGMLDIKASPDGKTWFYGSLSDFGLFYHENGTFFEIEPPGDLIHASGTLANIAVDQNAHVWAIFKNMTNTASFVGEYDGIDWMLYDVSSLVGSIGPGDNLIADSQGNMYMLVKNTTGPNFLKFDGLEWTASNAPATVNDYLNQRRPLYMDASDVLWIGLQNNTFIQYDGQNWNTIDMLDYGLDFGFPDGLFIDDNNKKWIIYWEQLPSNRISHLVKIENSNYEKIDLSNSGLPTNAIYPVFIDHQNNKWLASWKELVKFDGTDWTLIERPNGYSYAFMETIDPHGNIWFNPNNSKIRLFDGLSFSEIGVFDSNGIPYNSLKNIVVDQQGKVYVATDIKEVLVFDHGIVSHIESNSFDYNGIPLDDPVKDVTLDDFGNLYSFGFGLHKFENNEWTNIPLWTSSLDSYNSFEVAPNQDIWISYGIFFPGGPGLSFHVYDGTQWSQFNTPLTNQSMPEWDSNGHLWVSSDQGLCKYDGSTWTCYDRSNSPLNADAISSFKIDESDNIWVTESGGGCYVFNENQIQNIEGQSLPLLTGCIYRDYNQNEEKDTNDLPLALHSVLLLPDSITTFSNFEGTYRFAKSEGDYESQYIPAPNWAIDNSPDSYTVTIDQNGISGLDFRVEPLLEINNLELFLNEGFPRCNRKTSYWLTYWNHGTTSENGELRFYPDPLCEVTHAFPPADYFDGDTMVWVFNDFLPYQQEQISFHIQMPDETWADSTLIFGAFIDRQAGNELIRLDEDIAEQILLCSYDPNDKTGKSSGETRNGESLFQDPIEYTIRFQNTGNDTAFTIVIRDTLDSQLDLNTFEILGASHTYDFKMENNGAIEFRFEDILLPDSTINELLSHGFVSYRIKVKHGLNPPVIIRNRAFIYFDFNGAILTNSTENVLIPMFTSVFEVNKEVIKLKAFPNPAHTELQVSVIPPILEKYHYKLFNSQGQLVKAGVLNGQDLNTIPLKEIEPGVYWIRVENKEKAGIVRFVKI